METTILLKDSLVFLSISLALLKDSLVSSYEYHWFYLGILRNLAYEPPRSKPCRLRAHILAILIRNLEDLALEAHSSYSYDFDRKTLRM